ncbi:MAG: HAD family hydrolase [Patescibacteria group bacterium]
MKAVKKNVAARQAKPEKWVICFDLDDTLLPTNFRYHEASWKCGLIIARALGTTSVSPLEIIQLQSRIDEELLSTYGFQIERFPQSWVRTYEYFCDRLGVEPNAAVSARLYNTASHFKYGPFRSFAGMKALLQRLRRSGCRLHLITMGVDHLQRRKVRQAGLEKCFETIQITARDKRSAMAEILRQAQSRPVMMVGDSLKSDMRPAKELGITTVWISHPLQDPSAVKPDHSIRSVHELPKLLEKLPAARRGKKRY